MNLVLFLIYIDFLLTKVGSGVVVYENYITTIRITTETNRVRVASRTEVYV